MFIVQNLNCSTYFTIVILSNIYHRFLIRVLKVILKMSNYFRKNKTFSGCCTCQTLVIIRLLTTFKPTFLGIFYQTFSVGVPPPCLYGVNPPPVNCRFATDISCHIRAEFERPICRDWVISAFFRCFRLALGP